MSEPDDNPYRPIHIDGEAMARFIQFGDGEPIPCTDIRIEWKREPLPDVPRLPLLSGYEVTLPLPPETMSRMLRMVGLPEVADRVDIATHPDLAELNVQMDGFYGGAPS